MSDFVVHTPEQLAERDAAMRELQAENARLRAHIEKSADKAMNVIDELTGQIADTASAQDDIEELQSMFEDIREWHLAALNPTESAALGETK